MLGGFFDSLLTLCFLRLWIKVLILKILKNLPPITVAIPGELIHLQESKGVSLLWLMSVIHASWAQTHDLYTSLKTILLSFLRLSHNKISRDSRTFWSWVGSVSNMWFPNGTLCLLNHSQFSYPGWHFKISVRWRQSTAKSVIYNATVSFGKKKNGLVFCKTTTKNGSIDHDCFCSPTLSSTQRSIVGRTVSMFQVWNLLQSARKNCSAGCFFRWSHRMFSTNMHVSVTKSQRSHDFQHNAMQGCRSLVYENWLQRRI